MAPRIPRPSRREHAEARWAGRCPRRARRPRRAAFELDFGLVRGCGGRRRTCAGGRGRRRPVRRGWRTGCAGRGPPPAPGWGLVPCPLVGVRRRCGDRPQRQRRPLIERLFGGDSADGGRFGWIVRQRRKGPRTGSRLSGGGRRCGRGCHRRRDGCGRCRDVRRARDDRRGQRGLQRARAERDTATVGRGGGENASPGARAPEGQRSPLAGLVACSDGGAASRSDTAGAATVGCVGAPGPMARWRRFVRRAPGGSGACISSAARPATCSST